MASPATAAQAPVAAATLSAPEEPTTPTVTPESEKMDLPALVPNLVDAIFTGFPGNSGETLRITIRDDEKTVRPTD